MKRKENNVEITVEEDLLWKKSPVDSPLEKELATQVKCSDDVSRRVFHKEWKPKGNLNNYDKQNEINMPLERLDNSEGVKIKYSILQR
jgi:hypothetical protein